MFDSVENGLLAKSLRYKPKKYSARKYEWHRFWKGERSCLDSKKNECLCWSSRPKASLKEMFWEVSQNSQENTCAGISFLVSSCIRKNTFFVEQHRTTGSDYRSVNSSEGSIDKQNRKLWYKNSSICVNLSQKCKLLKRAVQVKEQVSEAVTCRPQIRCS